MSATRKMKRNPAGNAHSAAGLPTRTPSKKSQASKGDQANLVLQGHSAPPLQPGVSAPETPGKTYEVGYGKPPMNSRFKKGQSGNPKGRRKKLPTPAEAAAKLMQGKMIVTENGVTKKITRYDVLFLQMFRAACKGDTRAMALLTQLLDRYAIETASDSDPLDLQILTNKELEALLEIMLKYEKHAFQRDLKKLKAKHGVRDEDLEE